MTKKTDKAGNAGANQTQQRMNEVYVAHQVHTLAQIMFQQLTSGWAGGQSWASAPADPFTHGAGSGWSCGTVAAAPGSMPTAGNPIRYWYP